MASRRPRFTEAQLRMEIGASRSWAETLRRLGYRSAGGNWKTLQKYARIWKVPTDHFDPAAVQREALWRQPIPLDEVMAQRSTYSRDHLKRRLFTEGLKERRCEECDQDENWRGARLALILDHINGVPDDHRLENLRILCPNCAATLDTHCSRKNRIPKEPRRCERCGVLFVPQYRRHRYCSRACGSRWDRSRSLRGIPRRDARKVERPPYEQLLREIEESSYLAVGRRYGVSDNAIRKWVRFYEREAERDRLDAEAA